jgi:hypothetical protein
MEPGDRRKHHRVEEDLQAILVGGPRGTAMRSARVRDLSEGGACIELEGTLPQGAETTIGFFLKDQSRPLVAVARVIWTRPDGIGHVMGVAFSPETNRAEIARLREYLGARRLELVVSES